MVRGAGSGSVPPRWMEDSQGRAKFLGRVGQAGRPLLICDYDGTLAPFQRDKMQAVSYPGTGKRLQAILDSGTEVAFVSGRPSEELVQLLPLAGGLEIWGMHGREHRAADGTRTVTELTASQVTVLDQVQAGLEGAGWTGLLERKPGSLALHWRTLEGESGPARTPEHARAAAEKAFGAYAGQDAFAVLPFDGGLELRTEDRTKAHAVEALLAKADPAASAFLGDDLTDEDGFRVMRDRGGLGLLVRPDVRPSAAAYTVRPPEELFAFLDQWIAARAHAGSKIAARVL